MQADNKTDPVLLQKRKMNEFRNMKYQSADKLASPKNFIISMLKRTFSYFHVVQLTFHFDRTAFNNAPCAHLTRQRRKVLNGNCREEGATNGLMARGGRRITFSVPLSPYVLATCGKYTVSSEENYQEGLFLSRPLPNFLIGISVIRWPRLVCRRNFRQKDFLKLIASELTDKQKDFFGVYCCSMVRCVRIEENLRYPWADWKKRQKSIWKHSTRVLLHGLI